MISFLRDRLQGIVAFSFLGIVALTFMFLGLPTFTQNFNTNDYAKVGEYGISQSEYFRTRNIVEENIREQFGQQIDLAPLNDFIDQQARSSLIEKYTLVKFFDELGLEIPSSYLENELAKNEVFQVDGQFNQDAFKNYLINFNLSKDDLVNDFASDLKLNLTVALLNSTANIFNSSLDQYLELLTERRSIQFFELSKDNVIKEFDVSQDELNTFYQSNLDFYQVPEKRTFATIKFSKENLAIEVSDEELDQAYESYLQTIPAGEKRVSHLMVISDNYETNQEFTEKVNSIETVLTANNFEDYVVTDSEDEGTLDIGGDLGFTDGQIFPAEFEQVIASLDVNAVSKAVFYEGNAHFLKVTEIDEPIVLSFDEKAQDLRDELEDIKFEDLSLSILSNLSGSSLELTEAENVYGISSELLTDISFGDNGLSAGDQSTVFTAALKQWTDPIEERQDSFKIAYVVSLMPAKTIPLESVLEEVRGVVVDQKRNEYLEEVFADDGLSFDEAGLKELYAIDNFKIEEFKNINRTTSLLANDLVNLVFNEPMVGTVEKQLLGDKLFVFSVLARNQGDKSSVPVEDLEAIKNESRSSQLQSVFNTLRLEYGYDDKYSVNTIIANQTS
ncbi:MAG: hypothetical protein CBD79_02875 [Gammaproteobacteria bacterium TMED219]|nr:MAG: hypothetical protein CBD79_02875 [Gammaproteobacteria bacterium TMED219]